MVWVRVRERVLSMRKRGVGKEKNTDRISDRVWSCVSSSSPGVFTGTGEGQGRRVTSDPSPLRVTPPGHPSGSDTPVRRCSSVSDFLFRRVGEGEESWGVV